MFFLSLFLSTPLLLFLKDGLFERLPNEILKTKKDKLKKTSISLIRNTEI